jgi:uncharacterized protein
VLERLLLAFDRHPRMCQAVLAALLVAAAVYLPRIRIDDSPERWLPASTHEAWQVLDSHFNFGDTVAVGLEYTRPIRDTDLAPLREFRKQLAALKGMRQVYDASFVAEDIEGVTLTQLLDPANSDKFHLYEGALWNRLRNDQEHQTLLIACELYYPNDQQKLYDLRRNLIDGLYHLIDAAKAKPEFSDVRFHVAGGILLADELEQRARTAAKVFLPLSMLVGAVILLLGFRSLRALILTTLGGGAAMMLVVGYVAWTGGGLGALTISAPTLISIIAIATTVHFASYAADHDGHSIEAGRREHLVRWVAVPCLGVAILTAVGFLMLVFNELTPVRALGFELFAGSLLAFFGVFIFSQVLPIRRAYPGRFLRPEGFQWWSDWLSRHAKLVVGLMLLGMLVFSLLAWPWSPTSPVGLKVDVDPFSFFGPENHLVKSREHFLNSGFGLYQLEVILIPKNKGLAPKDNEPGDAVYQANQRAADEYSNLLTERSDLGVLRVVSTGAMRQRQSQFYEELTKSSLQGGVQAMATNALRMAKLMKYMKTFEDTFENWNHDKLDQGAIRLTFLAHDRVPGGFPKLLELAQSSIPPEFKGFVSGTIASVVQLADGLVSGMAWGVGVSVVIMWLVCAVLFKSWRLAAIAFFPNAFPIIVVYGYMGAVGSPLSSGSAMVATVSLGMNQTIYILMRYRRMTRAEGYDTATALRETFTHIGRPVVLTSMVFTFGFLIFLLSDFLPLHNFGLLTSIAMVAGLASDIAILPCLCHVFDRVGRQ